MRVEATSVTPEISEFSYGFALTNEIVGWAPISTAPLFPSLIEEGKEGGGYDVRLDMPGVPLYLQFKRADCMTRRSAREMRDYNLPLTLPFYRFKITEAGKSNQHLLLLELDNGTNAVFYAAPRFHALAEIDAAWTNNEVASRSIFVAPRLIGELDNESHHVAFDDNRAFLCSDPRPVDFLTSDRLVEKLQSHLNAERQPLRDRLPELMADLDQARQRAEERLVMTTHGHGPFVFGEYQTAPDQFRRRIGGIATRIPRPLSETERGLREIADTAAKVFNAQLIIVQEAD